MWQTVPRSSIGGLLVLVAFFALACGSSDVDTAGQVPDLRGVKAVAVEDIDHSEVDGVHEGETVVAVHQDGLGPNDELGDASSAPCSTC